ncbi:MAG: hypothetical protein AAGL24_09490 [Pseudomonadota bacterium]
MLNQMIVFRAAMTRSGEMEYHNRHHDSSSMKVRLPTIAGGAVIAAGLAVIIAAHFLQVLPDIAG